MTEKNETDATQMLNDLTSGDATAAQRLLPLVYAELRALAGSLFRGGRSDHTLQPTALVHEAYIKLVDQSGAEWNNRIHFFAVAATAMRQILSNHARAKRADKRGAGWGRVTIDVASDTPSSAIDLVALDEALEHLVKIDPRMQRVVELRFFAGMTVEEVAKVLDVSKTTVEGDWRTARAWLKQELADS